MAEQSPAANPQVFETPVARLGREGLQLNKALDDLTMQEVSRISNLFHTGGELQTRLGQTQLATLTGTVHSIRRLNNPRGSNFTRFWGAGTSWYRGVSGSPSALDAGLSGNPLTFISVRPPFSGESWMVMADSLAMRKATMTGNSLPLGLPAPGVPTVVVNAGRSKDIAKFEAADGTAAASWTKYGSQVVEGQTSVQGDPTLSDVAGFKASAVNLATFSNVPAGGDPWPAPTDPGDVSGPG